MIIILMCKTPQDISMLRIQAQERFTCVTYNLLASTQCGRARRSIRPMIVDDRPDELAGMNVKGCNTVVLFATRQADDQTYQVPILQGFLKKLQI